MDGLQQNYNLSYNSTSGQSSIQSAITEALAGINQLQQDLDANGNKILNLQSATNSSDATNLGQVQFMISQAQIDPEQLPSLNAINNTVPLDGNLNLQGSYQLLVNNQSLGSGFESVNRNYINNNNTSERTTTNDSIADSLQTAKDYTDSQDALLQTDLEQYVDNSIATLTTYVDNQDQAILQDAKDYTDAEVLDLQTQITTQSNKTLYELSNQSANNGDINLNGYRIYGSAVPQNNTDLTNKLYVNLQDEAVKTEMRNYTDTRELQDFGIGGALDLDGYTITNLGISGQPSSACTVGESINHASTASNIALQDAKTYTDSEISDVNDTISNLSTVVGQNTTDIQQLENDVADQRNKIRSANDLTSVVCDNTIGVTVTLDTGKKVLVGGQLDMNVNKIINCVDPTSNQDVATKLYVDQNAGGVSSLSQLTIDSNLDLLNTYRTVNCLDPLNAQDVVTKSYADTGLSLKRNQTDSLNIIQSGQPLSANLDLTLPINTNKLLINKADDTDPKEAINVQYFNERLKTNEFIQIFNTNLPVVGQKFIGWTLGLGYQQTSAENNIVYNSANSTITLKGGKTYQIIMRGQIVTGNNNNANIELRIRDGAAADILSNSSRINFFPPASNSQLNQGSVASFIYKPTLDITTQIDCIAITGVTTSHVTWTILQIPANYSVVQTNQPIVVNPSYNQTIEVVSGSTNYTISHNLGITIQQAQISIMYQIKTAIAGLVVGQYVNAINNDSDRSNNGQGSGVILFDNAGSTSAFTMRTNTTAAFYTSNVTGGSTILDVPWANVRILVYVTQQASPQILQANSLNTSQLVVNSGLNFTGYTIQANNPVNGSDLVTKSYGDANYSGGGGLPSNSTLNSIATTNATSANIPMNSFKLTGLAAGSANGDSVRYEQLNRIFSPSTLNSVECSDSQIRVRKTGRSDYLTIGTSLNTISLDGDEIQLYANGQIMQVLTSSQNRITRKQKLSSSGTSVGNGFYLDSSLNTDLAAANMRIVTVNPSDIALELSIGRMLHSGVYKNTGQVLITQPSNALVVTNSDSTTIPGGDSQLIQSYTSQSGVFGLNCYSNWIQAGNFNVYVPSSSRQFKKDITPINTSGLLDINFKRFYYDTEAGSQRGLSLDDSRQNFGVIIEEIPEEAERYIIDRGNGIKSVKLTELKDDLLQALVEKVRQLEQRLSVLEQQVI